MRSIIFILASALSFGACGGWTNGYTYCRTITVNHLKVPSNQTNFPIGISGTFAYLATVANGGKVTNASGYDVIFTSDTAGVTNLNWETNLYTATTGAVEYWVRIPTLSSSADTVIYAYYGNSSVTTDQSNPHGTWDANFNSVWHLPNGSTLTALDSTSNGHNGTINSATATSGVFDGAGAFVAATPAYISASYGSLLGLPITSEAWIKTSTKTAVQVIYEDRPNGASPGCVLFLDTSGFLNFACNQTFTIVTASTDLTDGAFHYVVGTATASGSGTLNLYVDGTSVASTANSGGPGNTGPGLIGIRFDSTDGFNGTIDEVRISQIARAADWITTEYNNGSNQATFYTIGPQTLLRGPVGAMILQ
jgi:hypothetical protein